VKAATICYTVSTTVQHYKYSSNYSSQFALEVKESSWVKQNTGHSGDIKNFHPAAENFEILGVNFKKPDGKELVKSGQEKKAGVIVKIIMTHIEWYLSTNILYHKSLILLYHTLL
jgi:hypothetical protein